MVVCGPADPDEDKDREEFARIGEAQGMSGFEVAWRRHPEPKFLRNALIARPWLGKYRPKKLAEVGNRVVNLPKGPDIETIHASFTVESLNKLNDNMIRLMDSLVGPQPDEPMRNVDKRDVVHEGEIMDRYLRKRIKECDEEDGRAGPTRPLGDRLRFVPSAG
mmetsp:Transcript_21137/g.58252  ORF Transcript_21137/g.58252 Transcript_21137/m.58252 type:complete len:163 (+) Transcript_21137:784-1272(+)